MQEAAQCLDLLTVGLELRLLCRKYSLVPTTVKSWCGARQAMTFRMRMTPGAMALNHQM